MQLGVKNIALLLLILFNSGIFLLYGILKLNGFQFVHHDPPPDLLLKDMRPTAIMWYFFGLKKGYSIFVSLGQILPGVLILFKRTRFVGALLYLIVVSNILAINIFFGLTPYTLALSIILFANTWIILFSEKEKLSLLLKKI